MNNYLFNQPDVHFAGSVRKVIDHVKTPEQIQREFEERGETLSDWAAQNGYDRTYVYRVLSGSIRARRGIGHEIAVKLGLKKAS